MRKLSLFIATIATLLLSHPGCTGTTPATGGTETGNTTAVSIRIIGYQSSQLAALDLPILTVGDLEVDTAFVVLDHLRFRPFSACQEDEEDEGAEEIRFDGPFIVDLLNPEALSELEGVEIAAGRYCLIEMALKKLEDESGVMQDRSVLIEGRRSDDTPFTVVTEVDEEFELENEETGFTIEAEGASSVFFIAFDLDRWFEGVDLSSSEIEITGGSISIDDENNQEAQEEIEENLKHSADLFEDSDDDEDLDPEEQENPLAAGTSVP